MDSDGIVQVLLPRTHLHRDTEALHHLVAAQPDDVDEAKSATPSAKRTRFERNVVDLHEETAGK